MKHACEGRSKLVRLNKCILELLGDYGIVRVLSCFDVDQTWGLLALVCSYKVNFAREGRVGLFSYNVDDRTVSRVKSTRLWERKSRGSLLQVEVRVSYLNEYATAGMRLRFAELTVRRFKAGGSDVHESTSIADQRAFVMVDVANVEEDAPSGGGLVHEEPGKIVKPRMIVVSDDKHWDLEGDLA